MFQGKHKLKAPLLIIDAWGAFLPAHAQHFWGGCPGDAPLFHLLPLIVRSGEGGGSDRWVPCPTSNSQLLSSCCWHILICPLVNNAAVTQFQKGDTCRLLPQYQLLTYPTLLEEITILQIFLSLALLLKSLVFVS